MQTVNQIALSKLRNSEYFELVTDLRTMIPGVLPSNEVVDRTLNNFEIKFQELDTVMRVDQGSVFTLELKEDDDMRGNTWKAMDLMIQAHLHSPVQEEVESAIKIRRVFDVYGDFRKLSYNEESNDGRNLVQDLEKPDNAAHCAQIKINGWVPVYKKQLEDFKALQNERDNEQAFKSSGNVKAIRVQMDLLFREIINKVNSVVALGMASPDIENFIKLFNRKIKVYNDTLAARAGRNSGDEDNETPDVEKD
ncbi:DUF6261 family protein [Prolixibacteraceae bacterium Z1-6]|uniref:DUF6261 family protein n=1 Tax=Draconibacterium aestuarii TaxID=2998507 RepID=A0A9X3F7Z6_9BACT|nr:DUF6261 family protein [Prolixibacteraceae bacterium Z1-6]